MRALACLLAACVPLFACTPDPKEITEITAAPGMTVEEFNRLNAGSGAELSSTQADATPVSAPADLTIIWNGQSVTFVDRQSGGWIVIDSDSDDLVAGQPLGPLRIRSINFNIDRGTQRLADVWPRIEDHCRALARMAQLTPGPLPSAEEVLQLLQQRLDQYSSGGVRAEEVICNGKSEDFAFTLTASGYRMLPSHSIDSGVVYLQGYVDRPFLRK